MHYSFDFDYTLADSSEGAIICFNYGLTQMGLPTQPKEAIRKTIGLSLPKALKVFKADVDEDTTTNFMELFLQKADEVALENIHFYKETNETLLKLKKNGHYVSIVSTKYQTRIEAALKRDKLFHLIDYIIGGDQVSQVKPNPEGLNKAVKISQILKEDTYYIGDSLSDGECAQRANVRFVATRTGVTDIDELKNCNPVRIIDNLTELL